MPWRTATIMDERARFVFEAQNSFLPFSDLCRRYSISRSLAAFVAVFALGCESSSESLTSVDAPEPAFAKVLCGVTPEHEKCQSARKMVTWSAKAISAQNIAAGASTVSIEFTRTNVSGSTTVLHILHVGTGRTAIINGAFPTFRPKGGNVFVIPFRMDRFPIASTCDGSYQVTLLQLFDRKGTLVADGPLPADIVRGPFAC